MPLDLDAIIAHVKRGRKTSGADWRSQVAELRAPREAHLRRLGHQDVREYTNSILDGISVLEDAGFAVTVIPRRDHFLVRFERDGVPVVLSDVNLGATLIVLGPEPPWFPVSQFVRDRWDEYVALMRAMEIKARRRGWLVSPQTLRQEAPRPAAPDQRTLVRFIVNTLLYEHFGYWKI